MYSFIWFRNDLRLQDNYLLQRAADRGEKFIGIFIIDPKLADNPDTSTVRISFMMESLLTLKKNLLELGSDLVIVKADPAMFWRNLAAKGEITIFASEDYTQYSTKRDNNVQKIITDAGGTFDLIKNSVVYDSDDEILTNDKNPIKVFTRFKEKWLAKLGSDNSILNLNYDVATIFASTQDIVSLGIIQTDIKVPVSDSKSINFIGGEDEALRQWEDFKNNKIKDYDSLRNNLDIDGTSRLSPHYKWGTLSIYRAVRDCISLLGESGRKKVNTSGGESYLSELIWRDFYKYTLSYYPSVQKENYNHTYDNVIWEYDEEKFKAWTEGKTGYPVVDACMRQLNTTGWMHNRGRMIVASFLCKDLHMHWKYGEKYFKQTLIDFDISANNGGWQWSAGTGTDAAPYFRIFNPTEQGKRYDPKGNFIRRYIPELASVPDLYIHEPYTMPKEDQDRLRIDSDYPAPIVDHAIERKRALDLYKGIINQ